jgi:hypothetical protein
MFTIPIIIVLLLSIYFIRRVYISFQFRRQIRTLFSESKPLAGSTFRYEDLAGLPDPVQRYFKLALKDGQSYISYARFTHGGQFKAGFDKGWMDIKGEQYVNTETPGFIWQGTTAMFTARDMYIADKGRLLVSLFNLFKVVDAKGPQYDQVELLRWMGESVLYPTNLLSGKRLQWSGVDDKTANLTFTYNRLSLLFEIRFNEVGEILQMETKRYMDTKNLETWIIKLADYKEINNVVVPTAFEVSWGLKTGDFTYAKFFLKKIEYDQPVAFANLRLIVPALELTT